VILLLIGVGVAAWAALVAFAVALCRCGLDLEDRDSTGHLTSRDDGAKLRLAPPTHHQRRTP